MKWDRRNSYLRDQYDQIVKCLYSCVGNKECDKYYQLKKHDKCSWYIILNQEVEKVKEFGESKTFPLLEVIIKKESNKI